MHRASLLDIVKESTATRKGHIGRWWIVLPCIVALALLAVGFTRNPATEASDHLLDSILSDKPDTAFSYASPEEISSTGLSKEKWRRIYKDLILPEVRASSPIGKVESRSSGVENSHGITMYGFKNHEGSPRQLGLEATITSDGPKTALLARTLTFAWRLKNLREGRDDGSLRYTRAVLDNLPRHRAYLEELGITGWYSSTKKGFRTWDEILEEGRQNLVLGAR